MTKCILAESLPQYRVIKELYPHFYHKRGHANEPVSYEKPGQVKLSALKAQGVTIDHLAKSYAFMTEFLWQVVEASTDCRSISVIDVAGIGLFSFDSEALEYMRKVSAYSKERYPNRCGYIFIVNAPSWFDLIWRVVHTLVDPAVRKKITIVKESGDILTALSSRIPVENIPAEYGGLSVGHSDEEVALRALADFNNNVAGAIHPFASGKFTAHCGCGCPKNEQPTAQRTNDDGFTLSLNGQDGPDLADTTPHPASEKA
ncbi:hypothetical protein DYB26_011598 [Aphanomyces astaci]|uniref:CRAL-TRIO domain-containing protein n=1 Tax=Aphanomyces astaci TaxID=112090 RepID=A0A397EQY6_APHAT|nr:hypothetical protein DYB36_012640 [Aphanomyces astaci]RHY51418.1 hypothetical protein DYB34_005739 [Aphanomyces astaci]RHY54123.1 hypothetical protein DYB38_004444 [Aphanomyces astaci]RHZ01329.1 hypothetical protein DYB31_014184 [Aphanomyces astaci]RHZ18332.1 hypothetical protein DYB26_011598 [Aphanomyces astaci]